MISKVSNMKYKLGGFYETFNATLGFLSGGT